MSAQIGPEGGGGGGFCQIQDRQALYNVDLDENQDGQLTHQELNSYVMKSQLNQMENQLMKRFLHILLILLTILFIALILLIFGLRGHKRDKSK